jgi:hypothetical protein
MGGCEPVWSTVCLGVILGSSCGFSFFPLLCLYCCTFTVGLGYQGVRCYLHFHPALRVGVSVMLSLYIPYHYAVFEALETRDSVSTTFLILSSIPSVPTDASVPRTLRSLLLHARRLSFSSATLLDPVNCAELDPALWSSPAVPYRGIGGPLELCPTPSGEGPERVPYPRLPQDPCRSIPRCNPRTRLFQLEGNRGSPFFGIVYRPITRVLVLLVSMGGA